LEKNQAVLLQNQASDQWAYYQAKGIKSTLSREHADMAARDQPEVAARLRAVADRHQREQEEIEKRARGLEGEVAASNRRSEALLERHHTFAKSVTIFQIAIALSAIAALIKRRTLWMVGLAAGGAGAVLLAMGWLA
jgi:hypothetical protein